MDDRWVVLSQAEVTVPDQAGSGYVAAVRVTFRTALGNVGTVDIPRASYGVDAVRAAIDAHAATLDEISNL